MPSLKEVEIRTKDLERWYKNGCKLPDVLYESSCSSSVVEKTLPSIVSPVRHPLRSQVLRESDGPADSATNHRGSPASKHIAHSKLLAEQDLVSSPKHSAAARDFEHAKSLMGRLPNELLGEVCDVKQPSSLLRQLLQAACSALGKCALLLVAF